METEAAASAGASGAKLFADEKLGRELLEGAAPPIVEGENQQAELAKEVTTSAEKQVVGGEKRPVAVERAGAPKGDEKPKAAEVIREGEKRGADKTADAAIKKTEEGLQGTSDILVEGSLAVLKKELEADEKDAFKQKTPRKENVNDGIKGASSIDPVSKKEAQGEDEKRDEARQVDSPLDRGVIVEHWAQKRAMLKKRNLLLKLPLLLLPFLTLGFWAFKGIAGAMALSVQDSVSALGSSGLNTTVPRAHLTEALESKMSYYAMQDGASKEEREAARRYGADYGSGYNEGLGLGLGMGREASLDSGALGLDLDNRAFSRASTGALNREVEDPKLMELEQRIAALQTAIQGAGSGSAVGAAAAVSSYGASDVFKQHASDLERLDQLNAMIKGMTSGRGTGEDVDEVGGAVSPDPDPDLLQINQALDKLLAIQGKGQADSEASERYHLNELDRTATLKRQSLLHKNRVYAVRKGSKALVVPVLLPPVGLKTRSDLVVSASAMDTGSVAITAANAVDFSSRGSAAPFMGSTEGRFSDSVSATFGSDSAFYSQVDGSRGSRAPEAGMVRIGAVDRDGGIDVDGARAGFVRDSSGEDRYLRLGLGVDAGSPLANGDTGENNAAAQHSEASSLGVFYDLDGVGADGGKAYVSDAASAGDGFVFAAEAAHTQMLVSGASIKLRLKEPVLVSGVSIPKGSYVYGQCTVSGERLLVDIAHIRYQKRLFAVDLKLYDLDGMLGIRIPGAIGRDASKEGADRALQSVGMLSLDPSIGAQAAAAGLEATKGLLSRKVKRVQVTVKAGYPVLLSDDGAMRD